MIVIFADFLPVSISMARYRSYEEETKRLRYLLETVSTDEESFSEEDEDDISENLLSDNTTDSDNGSDFENCITESSEDCYTGKDGTKWIKKKF